MQGSARRIRRDWPAVIAAWAASGETAAGYCRREGIPTSRFYLWRRRVGQTAAPLSEAAFVEVARLPVTPMGASGVAVVTPAGWRVELACGFDLATLQRVLSCDEGSCSG